MALFQACPMGVIMKTITLSDGEASTNSRIKPNILHPNQYYNQNMDYYMNISDNYIKDFNDII